MHNRLLLFATAFAYVLGFFPFFYSFHVPSTSNIPSNDVAFDDDDADEFAADEFAADDKIIDGNMQTPASSDKSTYASSSNKTKFDSSTDFERYEGVVIVTKVLSQDSLQKLKQTLCFLSHGYNDRMKYDIVVFTTIPWDDDKIAEAQNVVKPAKLTIAVEAEPLEDQLAKMSKEELNFLRSRCGLEGENGTLTWFHHCHEPSFPGNVANLGYSWQAEFRAYHIWTHPAIQQYKYMMWLDADAMVGRTWDVDPMKAMVDNNLTVLYVGWPYGRVNHSIIKNKMMAAYNKSICAVKGTSDGSISPVFCKGHQNERFQLKSIAGNHHITNLEVFRKDVHQQFLKNYTGVYRFSREFDDQLAVTIVGLMEQDMANRTTLWHERSHGMKLNIAHHRMYDVQRGQKKIPKIGRAFYKSLEKNWTGLVERCEAAVFK